MASTSATPPANATSGASSTSSAVAASATEAYPMPFFAAMSVADVAASQRWYETLGFVTVFAMPGRDGAAVMAHMRWIKYADLLLRAGPPVAGAKGLGIALNFMVAEDIDRLAARAKAMGATFLAEIGDRPWNARDFTLADPDGFALTFTHGPLKKDLSFDEVMGRKPGAGG
jgi:uncharacterized glyoxalase superfamily protein PhnB